MRSSTTCRDSIVILMMGADCEYCEGKKFVDEYELARKTWASSLPDNVKLVYYDGGKYQEAEYKEDGDNCYKLHLPCEDDMKWTFKKTWMAYNYIYKVENPMWIFRTNTSTYVNVDNLVTFIDEVIGLHKTEDVIYASDIYSLSEACCPWPLCLYPRGNGILMSRPLYKTAIINQGMSLAFQGICDDIAIGNLVNTHNIINEGQYMDNIKGLMHGWYKCVDIPIKNGHQLSGFGDTDNNYGQFITIQFKKYRDREKEEAQMLELHEIVKNSKQDKSKWFEYQNNPSIFIGSILGYLDFNDWKKMDKNELYFLEISHKAIDDEQHWMYKEIQGKTL